MQHPMRKTEWSVPTPILAVPQARSALVSTKAFECKRPILVMVATGRQTQKHRTWPGRVLMVLGKILSRTVLRPTQLKQNLHGKFVRFSSRIDCFHPLMPMMLSRVSIRCSILQDLSAAVNAVRFGTDRDGMTLRCASDLSLQGLLSHMLMMLAAGVHSTMPVRQGLHSWG